MKSMFKINGLDNVAINYKPSKTRKSIAIKIKDGAIFLYSPININPNVIQRFIDAKHQWIIDKYSKDSSQYLCKQSVFKHNNQYLILGSLHKAIIMSGKDNNISCYNNHIYISLKNSQNLQQGRILLHNWIQQQTLNIVTKKCADFAKKMQVTPKSITVKHYKSRWGCCKNNGAIIFHDLLYMMPEFVIDAIVIHELAHLVFLNHSQQFWQYVYRFCPNYQIADTWLKEHKYQIYV